MQHARVLHESLMEKRRKNQRNESNTYLCDYFLSFSFFSSWNKSIEIVSIGHELVHTHIVNGDDDDGGYIIIQNIHSTYDVVLL